MENNIINLFENDEIFDEKMIREKDMSKIFINTTNTTFDNWARDGLITKHKIGGGVYYKLSEIRQLIKNSVKYKEVI